MAPSKDKEILLCKKCDYAVDKNENITCFICNGVFHVSCAIKRSDTVNEGTNYKCICDTCVIEFPTRRSHYLQNNADKVTNNTTLKLDEMLSIIKNVEMEIISMKTNEKILINGDTNKESSGTEVELQIPASKSSNNKPSVQKPVSKTSIISTTSNSQHMAGLHSKSHKSQNVQKVSDLGDKKPVADKKSHSTNNNDNDLQFINSLNNINNNSRTVNSNAWTTVSRKKVHHKPLTQGTASSSHLQGIPKLVYIHASRFGPDVTEKDISDHLKNHQFNNAYIKKVDSRYPDIYSSFKIGIIEADMSRIKDPNNWPLNVTIYPFFHRRTQKSTKI